MAGRWTRCLGSGVLQVSDFVYGQPHVKTAFGVAKHSVVSRTLTYMATRGHVVAALLEEMMDVRGSACFENCETQFRYSRCI